MTRTKLLKYVKKNHPGISVKYGLPTDELIADVARQELSERSLKSVGLLETCPYVICPAFSLRTTSDQRAYDHFQDFIDSLNFDPIGNDTFPNDNDVPNEDDDSGPKRYMSMETIIPPRQRRDNPFLFDLVKTIDKSGKSVNPLLCIDERRVL